MDISSPQPLSQHPTSSFQQPIKKHPHFFVLILKIMGFLILGLALLFGGYYLGLQTNMEAVVTSPTPTQAVKATTTPTEIPPTPTSASQNTKAVKAGLLDSTIFKPYSIDVPPGWTDARETTITAGIDKLTLTKNGYSVTIYQASMNGGNYMYKGDNKLDLSQTFTDYTDINGRSGHYRRGWTQGSGESITYTICQKIETGPTYKTMTSFGLITIVSPNPGTAAMLSEIDGMIASLTTQ